MKYTNKYKIKNTHTGMVIGIFAADTETKALDTMAKEAGYRSYDHLQATVPAKEGEIEVTDITQTIADVFHSHIEESDSLAELREALVQADQYAKTHETDVSELYDATDLPVFGGDDVDRPFVYSWDEENVLVHGDQGWVIQAR